jgi:hypothetical protein
MPSTCAFCNHKFKPKSSILKHYTTHTQVIAMILGLHQRVVNYKEFEEWHINNIVQESRS